MAARASEWSVVGERGTTVKHAYLSITKPYYCKSLGLLLSHQIGNEMEIEFQLYVKLLHHFSTFQLSSDQFVSLHRWA